MSRGVPYANIVVTNLKMNQGPNQQPDQQQPDEQQPAPQRPAPRMVPYPNEYENPRQAIQPSSVSLGGEGRPGTAPSGSRHRQGDPLDLDQLSEAMVNATISKNVQNVGPAVLQEAHQFASQFQEGSISREAASLLAMMQGIDSTEQIPDNQRLTEVESDLPANDLFQNLLPCGVPVQPSTTCREQQLKFRSLFLKTLFDDWKVKEYLLDNDSYFTTKYEEKLREAEANDEPINNPKDDFELCYQILTGEALTVDERLAILRRPKSAGDYNITEMMALWNAPEEFVQSFARGNDGIQGRRRSMLSRHPYPIGNRGRQGLNTQRQKLRKFYKHPNVILALYLIHVTKAFEEGRLEAFQSKLGRMEHGYHWIVFRNGMRQPKRDVGVPGVDKCVIYAIRLAGFANSVIMGYYSFISNDDETYEINGETRQCGFECMDNETHTNHLHCFKMEQCRGRVCANNCISLVNHLACSHVRVNVIANEKCNGSQVTIYRDLDGKQLRTLHCHCTCWKEEGNFSQAKCGFTTFFEMCSGAEAIEQVKNVLCEDANGVEQQRCAYTYIHRRVPQHVHVGIPEGEELGVSFNDGIAARNSLMGNVADSTFDASPVRVTFPQQDRFYCVMIDLETSGLGRQICRIIEYGALSLEDASCLTDFVNPGVESNDFRLSRQAFEKNKIRRTTLFGKKTTAEALTALFEYLDRIRQGRPLCLFGHNIEGFDLPILYYEAMRCGLEENLRRMFYVDTMDVARDERVWSNIDDECPESISLESLHESLFGEVIVGHHGAFADVSANARVLKGLDPDLSISLGHHVKSYRNLIDTLDDTRRRRRQ